MDASTTMENNRKPRGVTYEDKVSEHLIEQADDSVSWRSRRSPHKMALKWLGRFWKWIVIIVTPTAALPLIISVGTIEARCAYVLVVMAVYWMAEVMPIAVTAFMPVFMFPLLSVISAAQTSANYLKDTNFLFMGGLIMALGVEESNLHTRIALRVLLLVGAEPRWLLVGFMSVTAFLSMWISNTATTAMMVPIALAVLENLRLAQAGAGAASPSDTSTGASPGSPESKGSIRKGTQPNFTIRKTVGGDTEPPRPLRSRQMSRVEKDFEANVTSAYGMDAAVANRSASVQVTEQDIMGETGKEGVKASLAARHHSIAMNEEQIRLLNEDREHTALVKCVLLSIAYAANLGGTGTLTGTGPNLVFRGQLDALYPDADTGISFASWMPLAIPPMLLCLVVAWFWLQLACLGPRRTFSCVRKPAHVRHAAEFALRKRYHALGKITWNEWSAVVWFVLLIALWILRQPKFIPGWADLFPLDPNGKSYISDAVASMFVSVILFMWPKSMPDFTGKEPFPQPMLGWQAMQKKFPWAVLMLLGGGFALADGVKQSGLSTYIGCLLQHVLGGVNRTIILAIFAIVITFMTEVTSNTAVASIFIPIVMALGENTNVNPLYYALAATISPSFAFMLPVATPPNAIVYEAGYVKTSEMMWIGFVMNWLCICVTVLNVSTLATALFALNDYPDWAGGASNATSC